ncbi:hypothetical protein L9F63_012285, partial [Diploptera punctata]
LIDSEEAYENSSTAATSVAKHVVKCLNNSAKHVVKCLNNSAAKCQRRHPRNISIRISIKVFSGST